MAITDLANGDVLDEDGWQSVIDTVENTSSGHDHDGSDSKKVLYSTLSVSGSTALDGVRVNAANTAFELVANPFSASAGHDHDGTDSKYVETIMNKDVSATDTNVYTEQTKTFTFTPGVESAILGVLITGEAYNDAAAGEHTHLQMIITIPQEGTTSSFVLNSAVLDHGGHTYSAFHINSNDGDHFSTPLTNHITTGAMTAAISVAQSGGGNSYMRNLICTVWYLKRGVLTTSSGKFS